MQTPTLYYAYILESTLKPDTHYSGFSVDPHKRLLDHNAGRCPHICSNKPWRIKALIAFPDKERALAFERFLKSGTGRAFAKKHL